MPPTVGYADYYAAGHEIVCAAMQHRGLEGVYLDDLAPRRPDDQPGHAAAVAMLAVLLGVRLEDYVMTQRSRLTPSHAKEVVNLAVAGMLHDIGKAKLPPDLRIHNYNCHSPLDADEQRQWDAHARLSYNLVGRGVETSAATAILHHHQRFDGSADPEGDPARLAGDRIHIFARLLTAADLFDRVSNCAGRQLRRRPQRGSVAPASDKLRGLARPTHPAHDAEGLLPLPARLARDPGGRPHARRGVDQLA